MPDCTILAVLWKIEVGCSFGMCPVKLELFKSNCTCNSIRRMRRELFQVYSSLSPAIIDLCLVYLMSMDIASFSYLVIIEKKNSYISVQNEIGT